MTTKLFKLGLALFTGILLSGCMEKEIQSTSEDKAEVGFSFDINDFSDTKVSDGVPEKEPGMCKSLAELQTLANSDNLYANITIREFPSTPLKLRIRNISGNILQSDTYSFSLGTYHIDAVTITNKAGTDLFYAGVATGSKYENYIPVGERMLEKKLVLTEEHKFRKTPFTLYVLCAENELASNFGYAKWNFEFIKAHCFPIFVNACNDQKGDFQPEGTIKIEYKLASENNYTILHAAIPFKEGVPGSICFKDNTAENDNNELHRITIKITGLNPVLEKTVIVSTADLLNYKTSKHFGTEELAWDETMNAIHINLCDCRTWLFNFDCIEEIPGSKCVERLRFVEGNSSTGGSDDYLEFWEYKSSNFNPGHGIFSDYEYKGWGDIALYDTNASNGVFSLKNGIICRSINAVPYDDGKKIMQILLDVKAPETLSVKPDEYVNLFDVLIFDAQGNFIGQFPYKGKLNTPNANDNTYEFDDLRTYGLVDAGGIPISLPNMADICYRVGIRTYKDATWTIDIKRFWVQTQGN